MLIRNYVIVVSKKLCKKNAYIMSSVNIISKKLKLESNESTYSK